MKIFQLCIAYILKKNKKKKPQLFNIVITQYNEMNVFQELGSAHINSFHDSERREMKI